MDWLSGPVLSRQLLTNCLPLECQGFLDGGNFELLLSRLLFLINDFLFSPFSFAQVFLDHRPRDEVALLVSTRTNGATPMLMACRNGHLEVVEYLYERCDADIEQPGSVTFDGETIEGAPPLWVAAAAGHVPIVRFLVRRGASVNCTTKTNSTPLRAACFDGHFEIVKYLIEHGAGKIFLKDDHLLQSIFKILLTFFCAD